MRFWDATVSKSDDTFQDFLFRVRSTEVCVRTSARPLGPDRRGHTWEVTLLLVFPSWGGGVQIQVPTIQCVWGRQPACAVEGATGIANTKIVL